MSRHALYEKRPLLLASIAAAAAYFYLRDAEFPEVYAVVLKGAAVALLAAYAWLRHSSPDAKLLTWVLGAFGAGRRRDRVRPADRRAGFLRQPCLRALRFTGATAGRNSRRRRKRPRPAC